MPRPCRSVRWEGKPAHLAVKTASRIPHPPLLSLTSFRFPSTFSSLLACLQHLLSHYQHLHLVFQPCFPMSLWHPGKKKDRSVSPSLVVHLEIQSTFLLVSGMVCVCVREKERKKGKETVTVVTVLRVLRSKPSKLKNGGPGDTVQYRVCI